MCTVHELNAMNYKEMKRIPRMILSSYLSTHGTLNIKAHKGLSALCLLALHIQCQNSGKPFQH